MGSDHWLRIYVRILNNVLSVGLRASILEKGLYISLYNCTCVLNKYSTYLGFSLLEAPCEHVLHGPLLGMYWLQLCPHFGAPTLEAMLLLLRLFIVLMIAAHISPNVFSLQLSLANVLNILLQYNQCTHTYYTLHSHSHISYYVTLYYTTCSCLSCIFISSALRGRLAALDPLCPIQLHCIWRVQQASCREVVIAIQFY